MRCNMKTHTATDKQKFWFSDPILPDPQTARSSTLCSSHRHESFDDASLTDLYLQRYGVTNSNSNESLSNSHPLPRAESCLSIPMPDSGVSIGQQWGPRLLHDYFPNYCSYQNSSGTSQKAGCADPIEGNSLGLIRYAWGPLNDSNQNRIYCNLDRAECSVKSATDIESGSRGDRLDESLQNDPHVSGFCRDINANLYTPCPDINNDCCLHQSSLPGDVKRDQPRITNYLTTYNSSFDSYGNTCRRFSYTRSPSLGWRYPSAFIHERYTPISSFQKRLSSVDGYRTKHTAPWWWQTLSRSYRKWETLGSPSGRFVSQTRSKSCGCRSRLDLDTEPGVSSDIPVFQRYRPGVGRGGRPVGRSPVTETSVCGRRISTSDSTRSNAYGDVSKPTQKPFGRELRSRKNCRGGASSGRGQTRGRSPDQPPFTLPSRKIGFSLSKVENKPVQALGSRCAWSDKTGMKWAAQKQNVSKPQKENFKNVSFCKPARSRSSDATKWQNKQSNSRPSVKSSRPVSPRTCRSEVTSAASLGPRHRLCKSSRPVQSARPGSQTLTSHDMPQPVQGSKSQSIRVTIPCPDFCNTKEPDSEYCKSSPESLWQQTSPSNRQSRLAAVLRSFEHHLGSPKSTICLETDEETLSRRGLEKTRTENLITQLHPKSTSAGRQVDQTRKSGHRMFDIRREVQRSDTGWNVNKGKPGEGKRSAGRGSRDRTVHEKRGVSRGQYKIKMSTRDERKSAGFKVTAKNSPTLGSRFGRFTSAAHSGFSLGEDICCFERSPCIPYELETERNFESARAFRGSNENARNDNKQNKSMNTRTTQLRGGQNRRQRPWSAQRGKNENQGKDKRELVKYFEHRTDPDKMSRHVDFKRPEFAEGEQTSIPMRSVTQRQMKQAENLTGADGGRNLIPKPTAGTRKTTFVVEGTATRTTENMREDKGLTVKLKSRSLIQRKAAIARAEGTPEKRVSSPISRQAYISERLSQRKSRSDLTGVPFTNSGQRSGAALGLSRARTTETFRARGGGSRQQMVTSASKIVPVRGQTVKETVTEPTLSGQAQFSAPSVLVTAAGMDQVERSLVQPIHHITSRNRILKINSPQRRGLYFPEGAYTEWPRDDDYLIQSSSATRTNVVEISAVDPDVQYSQLPENDDLLEQDHSCEIQQDPMRFEESFPTVSRYSQAFESSAIPTNGQAADHALDPLAMTGCGQSSERAVDPPAAPFYGQATDAALQLPLLSEYNQATGQAHELLTAPGYDQATDSALGTTMVPSYDQASDPALELPAVSGHGQATGHTLKQPLVTSYDQMTDAELELALVSRYGRKKRPALETQVVSGSVQATEPNLDPQAVFGYSQSTNPALELAQVPGYTKATHPSLEPPGVPKYGQTSQTFESPGVPKYGQTSQTFESPGAPGSGQTTSLTFQSPTIPTHDQSEDPAFESPRFVSVYESPPIPPPFCTVESDPGTDEAAEENVSVEFALVSVPSLNAPTDVIGVLSGADDVKKGNLDGETADGVPVTALEKASAMRERVPKDTNPPPLIREMPREGRILLLTAASPVKKPVPEETSYHGYSPSRTPRSLTVDLSILRRGSTSTYYSMASSRTRKAKECCPETNSADKASRATTPALSGKTNEEDLHSRRASDVTSVVPSVRFAKDTAPGDGTGYNDGNDVDSDIRSAMQGEILQIRTDVDSGEAVIKFTTGEAPEGTDLDGLVSERSSTESTLQSKRAGLSPSVTGWSPEGTNIDRSSIAANLTGRTPRGTDVDGLHGRRGSHVDDTLQQSLKRDSTDVDNFLSWRGSLRSWRVVEGSNVDGIEYRRAGRESSVRSSNVMEKLLEIPDGEDGTSADLPRIKETGPSDVGLAPVALDLHHVAPGEDSAEAAKSPRKSSAPSTPGPEGTPKHERPSHADKKIQVQFRKKSRRSTQSSLHQQCARLKPAPDVVGASSAVPAATAGGSSQRIRTGRRFSRQSDLYTPIKSLLGKLIIDADQQRRQSVIVSPVAPSARFLNRYRQSVTRQRLLSLALTKSHSEAASAAATEKSQAQIKEKHSEEKSGTDETKAPTATQESQGQMPSEGSISKTVSTVSKRVSIKSTDKSSEERLEKGAASAKSVDNARAAGDTPGVKDAASSELKAEVSHHRTRVKISTEAFTCGTRRRSLCATPSKDSKFSFKFSNSNTTQVCAEQEKKPKPTIYVCPSSVNIQLTEGFKKLKKWLPDPSLMEKIRHGDQARKYARKVYDGTLIAAVEARMKRLASRTTLNKQEQKLISSFSTE